MILTSLFDIKMITRRCVTWNIIGRRSPPYVTVHGSVSNMSHIFPSASLPGITRLHHTGLGKEKPRKRNLLTFSAGVPLLCWKEKQTVRASPSPLSTGAHKLRLGRRGGCKEAHI